MRRWNGWGDDAVHSSLPEAAARFLSERVGQGSPPEDAVLEQVIETAPASRLSPHPLVSREPLERVLHARGQSQSDWIALRSGQVTEFPDGVAFPLTDDDVRDLIRFARQEEAAVIPYGGGTSVVGHIDPLSSGQPVLTVDMRRMNTLRHFDETSQLATFGAGICGPDLEAHLRARGFTLGHYPQSFEYSTLGGWIATRSSGQQSLKYGRIEKLFAGGWIESPVGSLFLQAFPASAAGPDLRELILGSEGRMGIITEATVRVTRLPEQEEFIAYFFPDFRRAQAAARQIAQAGLPLSMLRLSTPRETATTLILAGHENLLGLLSGYLSLRGVKEEKCMLMVGFTGSESMVKFARKEASGLAGHYKGISAGSLFGEAWHKNRFKAPYLRNTLWERGYAVDTLETATDWSRIGLLIEEIEKALHTAIEEFDERAHVFTHLSHLYPTGSNIYTTFIYRLVSDPHENLRRWHALKSAASSAIQMHGGTISHQHGVGLDHEPYLPAEKGLLGMAVLADVCHRFDPQGIMNPGKLITRL